jgi:hypothetical protein
MSAMLGFSVGHLVTKHLDVFLEGSLVLAILELGPLALAFLAFALDGLAELSSAFAHCVGATI